jgi:hypothetical protein
MKAISGMPGRASQFQQGIGRLCGIWGLGFLLPSRVGPTISDALSLGQRFTPILGFTAEDYLLRPGSCEHWLPPAPNKAGTWPAKINADCPQLFTGFLLPAGVNC